MLAGRTILRDAVKLDRKGVAVWFGVRVAVGIAIPMLIAAAFGQPLAGVSGGFGAFVAGFMSRQGGYRTRAASMLLASVALGISAFAGAMTGGDPVASIAITTLWSFAFGLFAALGPASIPVSVNAIVALVIFSNAPYDAASGMMQALCVVAGGFLQTVLLVIVWPLERFSGERRAVRAAYASLAAFATGARTPDLGAPENASIVAVSAAVDDPQPFASRGEIAAFAALADEAERLRGVLAALATEAHLLDEVGLNAPANALRDDSAAVGPLLREIADAVADGRAPIVAAEVWARLHDSTERVATFALPGAYATFVEDARAASAAVHAAWRAAAAAASGGVSGSISRAIAERDEQLPVQRHDSWRFGRTAFTEAIATLRANLTLGSVYARHALRLAVVVAVATILEHALTLQHGNWIVLTAVLVLRPDFSSTFARGVARVIGTIGGAILASVIAAAHPPAATYIALAIVFAGLGLALFAVGYVLFSAAITAYVVFLLASGGSAEHAAAADRVISTLIGGALALGAYGVWPTWSRQYVGNDLAILIDAQRAYGIMVLRAYLHPMNIDGAAIRRAQTRAWLARSNAEAAVEKLAGEPVGPRALPLRAARDLLAATRRFGIAVLALRSRVTRDAHEPRPVLEALIADLDRGLASVANVLRQPGLPLELPPLHDDQRALRRVLGVRSNAHLDVLLTETDLVVESVVAMANALSGPAGEGT